MCTFHDLKWKQKSNKYKISKQLKNALNEKHYSQNSLSALLIPKNTKLSWLTGKIKIEK